MAAQRIIVTQDGDPGKSGPAVGEALAAGLANLPAGDTPTTGMVLKMVGETVGWYPARNQVPPLPYVAPVPGTVKPVDTSIVATLTALTTSLNNLISEHQNLLKSHNALMQALVDNGYMLPKSN